MHRIDEQDDVAASADLLENLLQALLEVTAVATAGNQCTEIEGVELRILQGLGHFTLDDHLGKPLNDGRLTNTRLTNQNGVVLRAP